MRVLAALLVLTSMGFAAQQPPATRRQPIRIAIRHADPWFVKAMLEGQQVLAPEISTILLVGGGGSAGSQGAAAAANNANRMFRDGHFVVNPTDNSLWFFPDQPKS